MGKKKKQGTLKGLERPTIEELDELCGELIEAEAAASLWKDKASSVKAAIELKMRENRDKLEKDIHEQPIYTYVDGEVSDTFVLAKTEVVRHRKAKKAAPTEDEGDIG